MSLPAGSSFNIFLSHQSKFSHALVTQVKALAIHVTTVALARLPALSAAASN